MILFNSGVKGISTCLNLLRFLDLIEFTVCAIHCPEGFIKTKVSQKLSQTWRAYDITWSIR